jgi:hypothetical protein
MLRNRMLRAQREDPLRLKSYPGNHPYPPRTMNRLPKSDDDLEPRIAATLLEVLIRAGLILILATSAIRCSRRS